MGKLIQIGENSITYLCFNQLIISLGDSICRNLSIIYPVSSISILVVSLLFLFLMNRIIINTKLKVIIEK